MNLTLIPVPPCGSREAFTHVARTDGTHEWKTTIAADYPSTPRGDVLFGLRVSADVTRRQFADLLGITPEQECALEFGRMTLSDEDWARAIDAATKAFGRKTP